MAFTEIYVDPSIGADSGAGTIGDPYGDLEYAIEQETFDTTNGTRVNIKAGTAEVLAAPLDTAMSDTGTSVAWSPGVSAPAIFQGYTAAAGDGGRAEIDLTTSASLINDSYVCFVDLDITNAGSATTIQGADGLLVDNCTIQCPTSGSNRVIFSTGGRSSVYNSYFYDYAGTSDLIYMTDGALCNCYIEHGGSDDAVFFNGEGAIYRNIIIVSAAGGNGIKTGNGAVAILHNSIYHSGGNGTGTGISGDNRGPIANNLIEGFAGAGGDAIVLTPNVAPVVGFTGNSVYNCTNNFGNTERSVSSGISNESLSVSPYSDAANSDFSPVDTGDVKEGSRPSSWNESVPA